MSDSVTGRTVRDGPPLGTRTTLYSFTGKTVKDDVPASSDIILFTDFTRHPSVRVELMLETGHYLRYLRDPVRGTKTPIYKNFPLENLRPRIDSTPSTDPNILSRPKPSLNLEGSGTQEVGTERMLCPSGHLWFEVQSK